MIKAAKSGGRIVEKYFGKQLALVEKSSAADFKTKADVESEAAILKILTTREFQGYGIFSEENSLKDKKSDRRFIVDPLDGTNNFVLGIPFFSIVIALLRDEEVIYAVIYNPIADSVYYAQKGKGAFLNGKKIRASRESKQERITVSYSTNYLQLRERVGGILKELFDRNFKRVLVNWSPALDLCLLASGKTEAVVNDNNEIYDFAAGKLIAAEAGALITDFKGNKESNNDISSTFLASNGTKIHQELLEILAKFA